MSWDALIENWMDFADRLCRDFPHLDPQAVDRFRGDRAKFVDYLADTHDLTLREAKETLSDWMRFVAPQARLQQAA